MHLGKVPRIQKGPGASSDLGAGQGAPHKCSGGCKLSQKEDEQLTSLWWVMWEGNGGTCSDESLCQISLHRDEGRMHKEDVGGIALPLEAPGLASVAGEERSRNGAKCF